MFMQFQRTSIGVLGVGVIGLPAVGTAEPIQRLLRRSRGSQQFLRGTLRPRAQWPFSSRSHAWRNRNMSSQREWEITRPIALEPKQAKGATLQDLMRLDDGELPSLNIAKYEIYRPLGKGGMSSVYLGMNVARSEPVVVKVLTRDLAEFPNAIARFMNEARLIDKVKHPNVVEVLDYGTTPEGLAYLVMPLYDGEDLRTILRREGRLPWPQVRTLLLQLCEALEAVHARAIVHCDVKPSNCLCVVEGDEPCLKLLDFGVARQDDGNVEESVVGTPDYMSPEQARGDDVDARSDIYSLGIMLGELLTGRVPFIGNSVAALLDCQEHDQPPSLTELSGPNVELSYELEAIYRRALAKDPAQRFASVREFAAALRAVDDPVPMPQWQPRARWRSLALAAGLALIVGVASAWVEASMPVPIQATSAER
jgi:serine/threonine-protein kinase